LLGSGRRGAAAQPGDDVGGAPGIELAQELELLRCHHVARDLELAGGEQLHGVGLAGGHVEEVAVGDLERAVRGGLAGLDAAGAVLEIEHPGRAADLPLVDGGDLADEVGVGLDVIVDHREHLGDSGLDRGAPGGR
jgi:hypothetical protein